MAEDVRVPLRKTPSRTPGNVSGLPRGRVRSGGYRVPEGAGRVDEVAAYLRRARAELGLSAPTLGAMAAARLRLERSEYYLQHARIAAFAREHGIDLS